MSISVGGKTLINWDPVTNKSTWAVEQDGETIIESVQPVDDIIQNNLLARNEVGRAPTGDYIKIASIPVNVLWNEQLGLMDAFNQHDSKYTARWLNDSDNRAWRTTDHRI